MATRRQALKCVVVAASITAGVALPYTAAHAGGYVFSEQVNSSIVHPSGYDGTGGQLDVTVCIDPDSEFADDMAQPIQNNIAVWNKLRSTTSNVRGMPLPSNSFDFESVTLHELGHCIGIAHPNVGATRGILTSQSDFSESGPGADGVFQFDPGPDGLPGTGDDVRGDDISRNFFYPDSNNPFAEQAVVDSSTYTRDLAGLPFGDTFAANADRTVSATPRYGAPNSEATMQQGTFNDEIQRTLGHDDVSIVRHGMSGLDAIQDTEDDYTLNLVYGGLSDAPSCDINVRMTRATGFAQCRTGGIVLRNSNIVIVGADMEFNPEIDWYFNNEPPCNESIELQPLTWNMISLPCQVGISTSATLEDVFGDDLGVAGYDVRWRMFSYDYTEQPDGTMAGAYRLLALDDELDSGRGYWIATLDPDITLDVQGEYNSQVDTPLFIDSAAGTSYGWNLVGMPYRFPVTWADTLAVDPVGDLLTLPEADPIVAGNVIPGGSGTSCSQGALPLPDCKVAQFALRYNADILDYETLTPITGALGRFSAAWVLAGDTGYRMRFPMPEFERTTP